MSTTARNPRLINRQCVIFYNSFIRFLWSVWRWVYQKHSYLYIRSDRNLLHSKRNAWLWGDILPPRRWHLWKNWRRLDIYSITFRSHDSQLETHRTFRRIFQWHNITWSKTGLACHYYRLNELRNSTIHCSKPVLKYDFGCLHGGFSDVDLDCRAKHSLEWSMLVHCCY